MPYTSIDAGAIKIPITQCCVVLSERKIVYFCKDRRKHLMCAALPLSSSGILFGEAKVAPGTCSLFAIQNHIFRNTHKSIRIDIGLMWHLSLYIKKVFLIDILIAVSRFYAFINFVQFSHTKFFFSIFFLSFSEVLKQI